MKKRSSFTVNGLVLLLAGCALCASGKTVALWKLGFDSSFNGKCMINATNDLSLLNGTATGEMAAFPTELPPNPDRAVDHVLPEWNTNSVKMTSNTSCFKNNTCGPYLNLKTAFTLEGWMKLSSLPAVGTWYYFAGAENGNAGRLIFSLRHRTEEEGLTWQMFNYTRLNGDTVLCKITDPDRLTNRWMHVALTFDTYGGAQGNGKFELFIDSVSQGTLSCPRAASPNEDPKKEFMLGGRIGSNTAKESGWDYWRLSDTVLTTNEFLNAPSGIDIHFPETGSSTIAYWKLDRNADGSMNLEDSIGAARLAGRTINFDDLGKKLASQKSAFAGTPPNTSVTFSPGNSGCVYGQSTWPGFKIPEMGRQLEMTNSFTVEGWAMPSRSSNFSDLQYLANNHNGIGGWAFGLKHTDGVWKFILYAEDSNGYMFFDKPISDDLSDWGETWKHVALVYDCTAGDNAVGVWTCYLDGGVCGVITNLRPIVVESASPHFYLGGCENKNFAGYLDCWRVTRAVLTPNQFMNAVDAPEPAPSSDVLALWPLDATADNLYIDGRDVVSSNTLTRPLTDAKYFPTASEEQVSPMIPNPDPSFLFKGDSSTNNGSVLFRTASGGARSYLATYDPIICSALDGSKPFTLEGFFNRQKNPSVGGWFILFGLTGSLGAGESSAESEVMTGMNMNFTYRTARADGTMGGYVHFDTPASGINDVPMPAPADDGSVGFWRHVALTFDPSVSNGVWSLYLDGKIQSSLTNSHTRQVVSPKAFIIGGRPSGENSIYGMIDSVRISSKVLTPGEFLNAAGYTPPVPAEKKTLAYWRLDSDGTSLDVASQVNPIYGFTETAYKPFGSTDMARKHIPRPDISTDFIGDAKANSGSVLLNGSQALPVQNLGYMLGIPRVGDGFTIEGWMKWDNTGAAETETIIETASDGSDGWRFGIDKSGVIPLFFLYAKVGDQTPFINTVFTYDIAPLAGTWHHLALVYETRAAPNGQWRLLIDGKEACILENNWTPSVFMRTSQFTLGGAKGGLSGFNGSLDSWRVTDGVLTADRLLYDSVKGTTILVW